MTTTTITTNRPAVRQFRSGRIYVVYCKRCGDPIPHGEGHIAGMHPIRSGVNCEPCFAGVVERHRAG